MNLSDYNSKATCKVYIVDSPFIINNNKLNSIVILTLDDVPRYPFVTGNSLVLEIYRHYFKLRVFFDFINHNYEGKNISREEFLILFDKYIKAQNTWVPPQIGLHYYTQQHFITS